MRFDDSTIDEDVTCGDDEDTEVKVARCVDASREKKSPPAAFHGSPNTNTNTNLSLLITYCADPRNVEVMLYWIAMKAGVQ